MNWINFLPNLRLLLLLIFAFGSLSKRFNWFENYASITEDLLQLIINLSIIIYGLVYIIELKLIVKQKESEINRLKTKLLQFEE